MLFKLFSDGLASIPPLVQELSWLNADSIDKLIAHAYDFVDRARKSNLLTSTSSSNRVVNKRQLLWNPHRLHSHYTLRFVQALLLRLRALFLLIAPATMLGTIAYVIDQHAFRGLTTQPHPDAIIPVQNRTIALNGTVLTIHLVLLQDQPTSLIDRIVDLRHRPVLSTLLQLNQYQLKIPHRRFVSYDC